MILSVIKHLKEELHQHFQPFLNPPATVNEIEEVEKEMNITFPEDLRTLYLTHNGEKEMGPGLFFGLSFLSLEEMVREWRTWKEIADDDWQDEVDAYSVPPVWIKEKYANPNWIPISSDGGGNHIGIDLDPDKEGKVGQVINFGADEEVKYVIAYHLKDFLIHMTNTLKEGPYTIDEYEEDFISWSYGEEEELHFLDAIRSMALPVLKSQSPGHDQEHTDSWFSQLDAHWTSIVGEIAENPQKFSRMKRLLLINEDLRDIKPLEICSNVRELILSANHIEDLTPLQQMVSLKKLYLGGSPIQDLKPIAQLDNLQNLHLANTKVIDLQPIADLSALKELDIIDIPAVDYHPLQDCKNLEILKMTISNADQLKEVSNIGSLKKLHLQGMKNIKEEDLQPLANLKKLKSLTIENICLENLDFLRAQNKLQTLIFEDSVIQDGSALVQLKRLTALELRGTSMTNLEVIARSASLKKFAGSFAQFNLLKDLCKGKVDFSKMVGEMSDEEGEIWSDYLDEQREIS
ncbi:SMI1/KNR4 family protein [Bacillus changyiensis]|uniref:SMI1/KNR4 family protein n=1 Tax=Bacillus changyiensis TaxID=3004103 RepID=UPI0022E7D05A|nr:SMI1/KNR4 family protein [Bacillus changyiensis]MDA1478252.1 SMI1/KNR4 family protein [Bacillus changyiensis]